MKKEDLNFTSHFKLNCKYSDYMYALVGYFDIFFPGKEVSFSTSPYDRETHWKQTVFYFRDKTWSARRWRRIPAIWMSTSVWR